MKIGLVQMPVVDDKDENLNKAYEGVIASADQGAEIVILPEMFCCPYDNKFFPVYAEPKGGKIYESLSRMAKEAEVVLVGGSFPESEDGKLYNSCYVFNQEGEEIANHRKAHLFDIDIKDGQRFMESEVFTPGDHTTIFEMTGKEDGIIHKFGVAICFDIRFAEFFRKMCKDGAEAIFVPAAFNMTTGPLHWELSFRMRAVDNQLFTVGVAPARGRNGVYVSYANSLAVSPWGKVIGNAGEGDAVLVVDMDLTENQRVRAQLPILSAMRPELY